MQKVEKRANGSKKITTINEEPSLTQQSFKDETNIVHIMKKYHAGQQITHLARNQGRYADLSEIKDYQTSLQTVINAKQAFGILPSEIRKRFLNDPQELLSFLSDPNNRDEAIKLGLINPPPPVPQTPPVT